jgi:LTXXQ motif family protein
MPGGGGRPGRGGAPPGGGRDASTAGLGSADIARSQLLELEEDLKLTSAQRPAWRAYYERCSRLIDDVLRNRDAVRFPKGSAPEQFDFIAQVVRNRMTAIEDITDAGKALYAALTADQKAMADNRLARVTVPLVVPVLAVAEATREMRRASPPGAERAR